jgi:hypothetical protein
MIAHRIRGVARLKGDEEWEADGAPAHGRGDGNRRPATSSPRYRDAEDWSKPERRHGGCAAIAQKAAEKLRPL